MTWSPLTPLRQAARVGRLVRAYRALAATRMAGLPVMHPALDVEAVGFRPERSAEGSGQAGVLITPWFMNLVWLADADQPLPLGQIRARHVGSEALEFTGAQVDGFGSFEACALWSPMFEFADAAAARATAQAVLAELRQAQAPARPQRRALLLGRPALARRQP